MGRVGLALVALLAIGWVAAGSRGPANAVVDEPELLAMTPLSGRPTATSFDLTLRVGAAGPVDVRVEIAGPGDGQNFRPVQFSAVVDPGRVPVLPEYSPLGPLRLDGTWPGQGEQESTRRLLADRFVEIGVQGLTAGSSYRWRVSVTEAGATRRSGAALRRDEFAGRCVTVRPRGENFTFCLFSDPHFFPRAFEPGVPAAAFTRDDYLFQVARGIEWYRKTRREVADEFRRVAANIRADKPDFVVGLGDHFDLHGLGFNPALITPGMAAEAHREARTMFASLAAAGSLYQLLGNWEGESGDHAPEHRAYARWARLRFTINPRPKTTRFTNPEREDYYAWEWGDALFVGLNVRGYTPTSHLLGSGGPNAGKATDFTLGKEQRQFLERVLTDSDHAYKFVLSHHAVGGAGGDVSNSDYGRGGGRAARVGEQKWVHELMLRTGAQAFFYGHDHVFTDIVVDGIHYALPGTTGAPWRFATRETGYENYWTPSGHARIKVTTDRAVTEFVSGKGEVLHQFEMKPRPGD